ncbi:MAG: Ig-like domain-containing protein [Bacteroidales bacterium]|nr:Ig-like domain-containing protein [Bacteroidales bacterium]
MKTNRSRLWMTTIVAFLSFAALIAGCKKDDYVETVGVCPVVVSTNPTNAATSVPLKQVITITFNEEMNPETINQESFTLTGGLKSSETLTGILTYNNTNATMSFVPGTPLLSNTTYTGRVKASVKDLAGNALQTDYVWTFSTGLVLSPTVISTDPVNNALNVFMNTDVEANFSVAMDPTTISQTTFMLHQGTTLIAGTVTYSGTKAIFTPLAAFTANTTYTGTITTGARNVEGAPIDNTYTWTFKTGSYLAPSVITINPANNTKGVALNKTVTATFSLAMNPLTITTTTFTLYQGTTSIAGVVSYTGTTASFNPSVDLLPATVYTGTITTGAASVAGMKLATNYVWTFTTAALTDPLVISTDPADNASGVAITKIVTGSFNMAMDMSTITTTTFTLKQGITPVSGTVSYSGTIASFAPGSDLLPGTTYTATITTGAKNLAGTSLSEDYTWSFRTEGGAIIPPTVNMGSAEEFGILAGVGVSNAAGFSVINNMNVGIYPGLRSSVTGFPPATIVNGVIYAADDIVPVGVAAMLLQAKTDLTAAYLFAEGATSPAPATVSGDQGGKTLAPGIYKSTSTLLIQSGDLTLDAQGDPNAVWIFQIASDFTTVGGAGGNVILSGGAQAKNVYWQTGSSATIGDYTIFQGNILALTSITMNSHATVVGRMLARNGAVVMTHTNTITKP